MSKRWIPFVLACMGVAFMFGLRLGAESEVERQIDMQMAQMRLSSTIAVVNGDAGIMVNGSVYNYSAAIINTLGDDFVLVSPAMAQAGFASGTYAAIVTFPSNVSARVLSFNAIAPERVQLEFQINPNLPEREYIETFIAITELQLAINTTLASTYVSSILRQFHDAQDHVDGVFRNNLADLFALEIITLGDFSANLILDDVPFVPIQPRELDTPFYMNHVRAFAEEVSNWYLDSYAMASNQFLWMRDGLIRLTDNFPEQEDVWLNMLVMWTRYSESYGELLDTFFYDVSTHEDGLRTWHSETVDWQHTLETYQNQVLGWHDTSNIWRTGAETWYSDYQRFLREVVNYSEALNTHHGRLEDSLTPVLNDLTTWRDSLSDYERRLRNQYDLFHVMAENHDIHAERTNALLADLLSWHDELYNHHDVLGNWRDGIANRQDALNTWYHDLDYVHTGLSDAVNIFGLGLEALPKIPERLPYDRFPSLRLPDVVPGVTSGPALAISGATGIADDIDAITADIGNIADDLDVMVDYLAHLDANIHASGGDLGAINTNLVTIIESLAMTIPYLPYPYFNNTYDINAYITRLNGYISQLRGYAVQLHGYTTVTEGHAVDLGRYVTLLDNHVVQLDSYTSRLDGLADELISHAEKLDCDITQLKDWYTDLQSDIKNILNWRYGMVTFHGDMAKFYGLVNDTVDKLTDLHQAFQDFSDELDELTMPQLPDISKLEILEPLRTPKIVDESKPKYIYPLEMVVLPFWDREIVSPYDYEGAKLYGLFDVEFPLDFDAIYAVIHLYHPPVFVDYEVPTMVDEHSMLMAYRPETPLVPAPPRPDDFWASLNLMHDQLLSFDVGAFLSDDIRRQVEHSLVDYEAFLESVRHDLNFLFEDNIEIMYVVNAEYNRFLQSLRSDVLIAAAYEQAGLQNAIETFTTLREINNQNTISRLSSFASMMPESRATAGINQSLVNFTVTPFDFVPMTIRDDVAFEYPESMVGVYARFQRIAIWVMAGVLAVTLASILIYHFFRGATPYKTKGD